jgi:hypothetical protein
MSQSCQHANQICDVRDQILDRCGYHPPAASDQSRCFRLRYRPQNIPIAASCALLKEVHDVPAAVPECDTLLPHRSRTPSGQTIAFTDPQIGVAIEAGPVRGMTERSDGTLRHRRLPARVL